MCNEFQNLKLVVQINDSSLRNKAGLQLVFLRQITKTQGRLTADILSGFSKP